MTPSTSLRWASALRFRLILLLLFLALLTACNLRENTLLPPNLDPKEYITESTIKVYYDHLIKSANDDSYLYIPKESITEAGLWYGDRVTLTRVKALANRDSLAFPMGSKAFTDSYRISVLRSGQEVIIDSLQAFATLYTDLKRDAELASLRLVKSARTLGAQAIEVYPYGKGRCWFDLDGSGEHALIDFKDSTELRLPATSKALQALMVTPDDYLRLWFPAGSLVSEVTVKLEDSLSPAEIATVQNLFPGFVLNTPIFSLEGNLGGTQVPIVYYRMPQPRTLQRQWTRLHRGAVHGWPQGTNTWLWREGELVSFLNGAGKFFLLTPLESQNRIDLPLDGSLSKLYLQDIWLDLRDLNLPSVNLRLDLQPDAQSLLTDYFQGSPFQLASERQIFGFSFTEGGTLLETLPANAWIEFGFRSELQNRNTAKLFRAFRSKDADKISFKTLADGYDATHYSSADGFIYSGVNSSGIYIFGRATEGGNRLRLPCLKPQLQLQTSRSYVSYNDPQAPCSSLELEYSASVEASHPWLSGSPYQLNSSQALLRISALNRGRSQAELPANLFISTAYSKPLTSVVNIWPSTDRPQFYRYKPAESLQLNSFVQSGGRLQIYPTCAGYLLDGAQLNSSNGDKNLAIFNRMVFDDYDWEVWLNSGLDVVSGTVLKLSPKASLSDAYGVFTSQYSLSPLAKVYSFQTVGDPDFYTKFQPLIRLRQSSRSQNLLFSVSDGDFYRIYAYEQSSEPDGWHFQLANGYASFYLLYDAEYAGVQDLAPHTETQATVTDSSRDLIASLYQAQATIPSQLLADLLPLGSHAELKLVSDPPVPNTLSAYSVLFRNPQQQLISTNFYTDPTATRWPYLYIPIPNYTPGQQVRLFFRDQEGNTSEFNRVQSFSEVPDFEYTLVGNCAVCFIDQPGLFYITGSSSRRGY